MNNVDSVCNYMDFDGAYSKRGDINNRELETFVVYDNPAFC